MYAACRDRGCKHLSMMYSLVLKKVGYLFPYASNKCVCLLLSSSKYHKIFPDHSSTEMRYVKEKRTTGTGGNMLIIFLINIYEHTRMGACYIIRKFIECASL